ncbi:unnamed protein product [Notodromas monacha]|uniref:Transketolase n=1 Tax=Notodromas monacha TaxID=399045 RepID=A0A7R9BRZ0_9CRUS|nr:unnamed protein product [Notodromas monacha]CAG0919697.1 unnamed protein product [Notodromas monacha]
MSTSDKADSKTIESLQNLAHRLRILSIDATNKSNSGHPTSCCSMAEIVSVLFFNEMRYKLTAPKDPANDRFILSKGHAAPILYAAWAEAGLFPVSDLDNLRKLDSDLEGHPTPRLNFVDVATGSLGQGLGVAAGMAYVGKYLDSADYRTYCLIGDGEAAEGSIWEALNFASYYQLDNLVAIFDVNRLGQSDPTSLGHDMNTYKNRLESFGFHALVVDGHNIQELLDALAEAKKTSGKPTAILAFCKFPFINSKTFKGKYIPGIEDLEGWHGKPLGSNGPAAIEAIQKLITDLDVKPVPAAPTESNLVPVDASSIKLSDPPAYTKGDKVATRVAYGTALVKLNSDRVIALDCDVKNSTNSEKLRKIDKLRHIECFIAEQNMVGVGIGVGCRHRAIPFCSTFATFFTRAFDQIRMGAISQSNLKFVGSHAGVSIGEDGPSQMGLEDLAMFRTVPNCTVFYPSDAVSTERAVEIAARLPDMCFIRTSRPNSTVIYDNDESFEVGKAKVVKKSDDDKVLVIGACVTLEEALTASKQLAEEGVNIRIMDPFTIKPIDREGIIANAQECGGKIITVEDHYPEGGLGEAVLSAVAECPGIIVKKLAVPRIPRSGPPTALLDMFGISAKSIVEAVKSLN